MHEYEQICTVPCGIDVEQDPLAAMSVTEHFNHIGGIYLSPDGQRFAFSGDGQLYVAALDGGDLIQLTHDGDGECTGIAFSPDSHQIAFARTGGTETGGIWVVGRSGENTEKLLMPIADGKIYELLWI
jgi:Tol biopolymer transport system component